MYQLCASSIHNRLHTQSASHTTIRLHWHNQHCNLRTCVHLAIHRIHTTSLTHTVRLHTDTHTHNQPVITRTCWLRYSLVHAVTTCSHYQTLLAAVYALERVHVLPHCERPDVGSCAAGSRVVGELSLPSLATAPSRSRRLHNHAINPPPQLPQVSTCTQSTRTNKKLGSKLTKQHVGTVAQSRPRRSLSKSGMLVAMIIPVGRRHQTSAAEAAPARLSSASRTCFLFLIFCYFNRIQL